VIFWFNLILCCRSQWGSPCFSWWGR